MYIPRVPRRSRALHQQKPESPSSNHISGITVVITGASFLLLALTFFSFIAENHLTPHNAERKIEIRLIPVLPRQEAPESLPQRHVDVPQNIIDMAMRRNVLLQVDDGHGSGARIGNGLVLTAWHVIEQALHDRGPILVNGHRSRVLSYYDNPFDMAILRVYDNVQVEPLDLRYDPSKIRLNTPVVVVGNPKSRNNNFQTGIVSRIIENQDYFEVSTFTAQGGLSGSLVYTTDGVCIGMVQMKHDDSDQVAVCHNLRPIKRLLDSVKEGR